jgi:hypothetical protein
VRILIDAGEALYGDAERRFLANLTEESFLDRLAEFEDPTWQLAIPVVSAANQQDGRPDRTRRQGD